MLARLHSVALAGIEAVPCEVEVDVAGRGFSTVTIVGLPDTAVKESLDRIRSAMANCGYTRPRYRTTINLAPADLKKEGPSFDLPIALGMIFAGGLGVLAGDHLKAASDLALPLVSVGILYRQGYFHQFLDQDGWQQEEYPETDIYHLPIKRAKDRSGNEISISITGPDGEIRASVWKIMVGRIPLYLLDSNLPETLKCV